MKLGKILAVICFLTIASTTCIVGALTQGDYHQKFWGGGLNVWVYYPEEARPGDDINVNIYIVSGKFPRGNQVEEVRARISVLTPTSTVLFDDSIIVNTYMPYGNSHNDSISITLPPDARWFLTIAIDTVSYQQDMSNRQEAHVILDATQIRSPTYSGLLQQILELQAYNAQLGQRYNELSNQLQLLQSTSGGDYGQIESEYLNLMEDYITLTIQYNELLSESNTGSNPDLEDAFDELQRMYWELTEEYEDSLTSLENLIEERDTQLAECDDRVSELIDETDDLVREKESIQEELDEFMEEAVSLEEYEDLESSLRSSNNIRNILAVTTLAGVLAALASFIRFRGG